MALVSAGVSISVSDQSQYVASNVGSIPLVILATAQDKMYSGSAATGTSKALAGKLQTFTSQYDLVSSLGTPSFQINATGTPINGSEINEYGLLTAYSALGLSNQLFAIRADIDLKQLIGTSVRPYGTEAGGTDWLNLASTGFGIYSLNSVNSTFTNIAPSIITITDPAQLYLNGNGSVVSSDPISSVGIQGSYALVCASADPVAHPLTAVRLFYKVTSGGSGLTNSWVQVGSIEWQLSVPTVQGTTFTGTAQTGVYTNVSVNGYALTLPSLTNPTVDQIATAINTAITTNANASGSPIPGVTVAAFNNQLTFFVSQASSGGTGILQLGDGSNGSLNLLAQCGITTQTGLVVQATQNGGSLFYCPTLFYGNYAQAPSGGWFAYDTAPRPSGSIWWKTTATATGWSPVFTKYNTSSDSWVPQSVPMQIDIPNTIYQFDQAGGGHNITAGQLAALYSNQLDAISSNSLRFVVNSGAKTTVGTGLAYSSFQANVQFTINSTVPGSATLNSVTITTSGYDAPSFVSDILNAGIPYVTAQVNANATISITHTLGGYIELVPGPADGANQVLINAGLVGGASSTMIDGTASQYGVSVMITNFSFVTNNIVYSATTPFANPADGILWYYSNPADVDIMVSDGQYWYGYRNITDVRGYDLGVTDSNGVIVTASRPTSNSQGNPLVKGDLWLNSSDLINYPNLSRYNGTSFIAIDNTDHTSTNGIIFADARWGDSGTIDPVSAAFPTIQSLLGSDYIDQDAPDPRLYPRGILLFNTRRSGFNVKKFALNYFNDVSFPQAGLIPGSATSLPAVPSTWVSASGLNELNVMYAGSAAQRDLVVKAMESAVNSNTDILDANYRFNLIVAPNYPELIPALVTLNDNRGATGFIIGDTPMTLTPNVAELTNWNNNQGNWAGKGIATASPYLGIYYPAGLTTDLAGNQIVVPASHAALRTYLYNDQVSYPWFAPAGVHRGLVSNLNDIGYIVAQSGEFVHNSINQGLRDALATMNINPITQLPNVGLVIWGQETRSGSTSARNRVNVVRLENYLRVIFASVSNGFLFEPNDTITRKSIATQLESSLHNILSLRGLYDFVVICDSSNNTSATIANSQLYVDVGIEPMRDVEFIYIPISIYNPGTIASLGVSST
jgi:hypothetical protein